MEWSEPKAMIAIRLPPDLHRAVKTRAAASSVTVETAYQQALEAWLNPPEGAPGPKSPECAQADEIMASGHPLAIKALQSNLKAFLELVRPVDLRTRKVG